MGLEQILKQIDRELEQLKKARTLLSDSSFRNGNGRGVKTSLRTQPKARNLTPEGRKRIAEAVRRRWAREKGQTGRA